MRGLYYAVAERIVLKKNCEKIFSSSFFHGIFKKVLCESSVLLFMLDFHVLNVKMHKDILGWQVKNLPTIA